MGDEKPFEVSVDFAIIARHLKEYLYPRREDALLELIKNADDAIVLRRAQDKGFASGRITIRTDRGGRSLSVIDNGSGISREEFEVFLSRLPASLQHVAGLAPNELMTRQWAAGFLGEFLLADRIEIRSKPARGGESLNVVLEESGTATITAGSSSAPGTVVTLQLRPDCLNLLDRAVLEDYVRFHCAFIRFPIFLNDDSEPVHNTEPQPARAATDEAELLARIEDALRGAHIKFEREPSVGGLQPDFVAYGPHGELVIVEAKSWPFDGDTMKRALDQVERYKEATGIESVLLVLGAGGEVGGAGVVAPEGLLDAVRNEFRKPAARRERAKPLHVPRKTVFAAMPFSAEYDDVFFVAMAYAAEKNGSTCVRVDREEFSGEVVDKIRTLIRESTAVICDLSEARPNVLYEAGFAHALDKPTIHICSTPLSQLPFDVRNWNTMAYAQGRTVHLRDPLTARLKAVLS